MLMYNNVNQELNVPTVNIHSVLVTSGDLHCLLPVMFLQVNHNLVTKCKHTLYRA